MLEIDGVEVRCCPAQARLLLLFTSNKLPLQELLAKSPFSSTTTQSILQSLAPWVTIEGTHAVLKKIPHSITLPSLTQLPTINCSGDEGDEDGETNLVDENSRISAQILTIVKKEKRITIKELMKQLREERTIHEKQCKTVLDSLFDLEYLRRDVKNEQIIVWE